MRVLTAAALALLCAGCSGPAAQPQRVRASTGCQSGTPGCLVIQALDGTCHPTWCQCGLVCWPATWTHGRLWQRTVDACVCG